MFSLVSILGRHPRLVAVSIISRHLHFFVLLIAIRKGLVRGRNGKNCLPLQLMRKRNARVRRARRAPKKPLLGSLCVVLLESEVRHFQPASTFVPSYFSSTGIEQLTRDAFNLFSNRAKGRSLWKQNENGQPKRSEEGAAPLLSR